MNPTIIIQPDHQSIAEYMAKVIVTTAAVDIEQNGLFSLLLSGGGTPQPLYEQLVHLDYAKQIAWERVHLFWGDDRLVQPTEDGSNYKQVKEALLDSVAIPTENVWRMKTGLEGEAAAADYRQQLKKFAATYQAGGSWPSFDLVLLGMGTDGHTASLFPHSPLAQEDEGVREVSADYEDRPAHRITLTEAILNDAKRIFVLVTGEKKAEMVANVIGGQGNLSAYPILRIRPKSGHLTFVLDQAAAQKLYSK